MFATDPDTAAYYEARANEYDEWYTGDGLFAGRDRPGWTAEVGAICRLLSDLPPARTLDVACGTGFLTRHLRGEVVATDRSRSMVQLAAGHAPAFIGDALDLGVGSSRFSRLFTGHFYGHLPPLERARFLAEAGRVAAELVVVDSAHRPGVAEEGWQERTLNDGSRHRVFKRYLTGSQLAGEIGGEVLFEGAWFVAARAGTGQ